MKLINFCVLFFICSCSSLGDQKKANSNKKDRDPASTRLAPFGEEKEVQLVKSDGKKDMLELLMDFPMFSDHLINFQTVVGRFISPTGLTVRQVFDKEKNRCYIHFIAEFSQEDYEAIDDFDKYRDYTHVIYFKADQCEKSYRDFHSGRIMRYYNK